MIPETVTITMDEYIRLKAEAVKFQYLRDFGVDNWEGFSDAMCEYYKDLEEEQ